MKNKKKNYIGIIDDFGVESFIEESKAKWSSIMFKLRAMFNRQRNAKAYRIHIDNKTAKKIQVFCDKAYWHKAKKLITENNSIKYL